jgi:hypothetical protein
MADHGHGWLLFADIMLLNVGVMNVIYGIAAIGNSSFYIQDAKYVVSDLNTLGWIVLIVGAVQCFAAFGIWRGGQFGPLGWHRLGELQRDPPADLHRVLSIPVARALRGRRADHLRARRVRRPPQRLSRGYGGGLERRRQPISS